MRLVQPAVLGIRAPQLCLRLTCLSLGGAPGIDSSGAAWEITGGSWRYIPGNVHLSGPVGRGAWVNNYNWALQRHGGGNAGSKRFWTAPPDFTDCPSLR